MTLTSAGAAASAVLAAQVDPLADVGDQFAEQRPQLVGQRARHAGHQCVEPPPARRQPLDQIAGGAALGDHAIQSLGVGAQRNRRLLGQPVAQRLVVPQHEHQPDRRGERIALADPDADVRAGGPDEFQQRDAVVDHRGQRGGGVVGRRTGGAIPRGPRGSTRIDSCAVCPSEISAGPKPVGLVAAHRARGSRRRSAW